MRVIAGKFGRRKLKGPGLLPLRPTSDRLRETLFNILAPAVEDSLFVDLYAGSGAIGIEALSRGARRVILVESNSKAARLVRENLAALEIRAGVELIEADALAGGIWSRISFFSILPTRKRRNTRACSNISMPRI